MKLKIVLAKKFKPLWLFNKDTAVYKAADKNYKN